MVDTNVSTILSSMHAANGKGTNGARWILISLSLIFLALVLVLPLVSVFAEALRKGIQAYANSIADPETMNAAQLTLSTALLAVPINTVFGVAAAWAITKYRFKGKQLLITLIDIPFAVSPVICGLVFVLLFGAHGIFGSYLTEHSIKIIFAWPGIVLATMFVTVPYVARELIPFMQALGSEEEEAAVSLGAGGWTIFWRVTFPNIKWGLLYGTLLCNARAIGEFGAVSVVSGHIRGLTNTLPLHVEILYNEYQFSAAFAVASLLVFFALLTLGIKTWVEHRDEQLRYNRQHQPGNKERIGLDAIERASLKNMTTGSEPYASDRKRSE